MRAQGPCGASQCSGGEDQGSWLRDHGTGGILAGYTGLHPFRPFNIVSWFFFVFFCFMRKTMRGVTKSRKCMFFIDFSGYR